MNESKSQLTVGTHRFRAYLFSAVAFVTCPCHLPIVAGVLAGTTAGAVLSAHFALSVTVLITVFVASLAIAIRAFNSQP